MTVINGKIHKKKKNKDVRIKSIAGISDINMNHVLQCISYKINRKFDVSSLIGEDSKIFSSDVENAEVRNKYYFLCLEEQE